MGQIVPDKRFNIPMALTWARIAFIPLIVGVFYVPDVILSPHVKNLLACVMFVVAAITDALDGYIARRYNMMTNMGAFLDSVADKLVVCSAIVVLLAFDRVDMLVALIIVGREIAVTALREWMAKIGAAASVLGLLMVAVVGAGSVSPARDRDNVPQMLPPLPESSTTYDPKVDWASL